MINILLGISLSFLFVGFSPVDAMNNLDNSLLQEENYTFFDTVKDSAYNSWLYALEVPARLSVYGEKVCSFVYPYYLGAADIADKIMWGISADFCIDQKVRERNTIYVFGRENLDDTSIKIISNDNFIFVVPQIIIDEYLASIRLKKNDNELVIKINNPFCHHRVIYQLLYCIKIYHSYKGIAEQRACSDVTLLSANMFFKVTQFNALTENMSDNEKLACSVRLAEMLNGMVSLQLSQELQSVIAASVAQIFYNYNYSRKMVKEISIKLEDKHLATAINRFFHLLEDKFLKDSIGEYFTIYKEVFSVNE